MAHFGPVLTLRCSRTAQARFASEPAISCPALAKQGPLLDVGSYGVSPRKVGL